MCVIAGCYTSCMQAGVCVSLLVATGQGGVKQSQLVDWYLKEIEADIEDTQELIAKKVLVEKIVERLVHHVSTRLTPVDPNMIPDCSL